MKWLLVGGGGCSVGAGGLGFFSCLVSGLVFNFITLQVFSSAFHCESGIWAKGKIHTFSSSSAHGLPWIKSKLLRRAAQQNTMYGALFFQVPFA